MDEERRAPRRLLSFDASQNPFSRIGKVFLNGPSKSSHDDGKEGINRSARYKAPGPIIAMSGNIDRNLSAIVGKNFIQILDMSVHPDKIDQAVQRQRLDKHVQPTCVEWGHLGTQNTIALATTEGAVYLYDVQASGLKATVKGPSTQRPLTSMSFSSMANGNILAGGGSDGSVRLWDTRQGLRRVVSTFNRPGDITREVRFRPEGDTKFAVIYDSGLLLKWDMRKPSAAELRINAHMQGLTLNWHPSSNYIATGGRDHLVHVWNMSTMSKTPEFTINTASPVGKVRWLPGDTNSVQNSALVTSGRSAAASNNRSLHFWLLKRSLVPCFSAEVHSDIVSNVVPISPSIVWSSSVDGYFVQHDWRYEPLVYDSFSPVVMGWSGYETVQMSFQDKPNLDSFHHVEDNSALGQSESDDERAIEPKILKSSTSLSFLSSSYQQSPTSTTTSSVNSGGYLASFAGSSSLPSAHSGAYAKGIGEDSLVWLLNRVLLDIKVAPAVEMQFLAEHAGSDDYFIENYLYTRESGQSFTDVCEYNSEVARQTGRYRTCRIWNILGTSIKESELEFLEECTGEIKSLAEKWFQGEINADEEENIPVIHEQAVEDYDLGDDSEKEDYGWDVPTSSWQPSGVSFNSEASNGSDEKDRTRTLSRTSQLLSADSRFAGSLEKPASESWTLAARTSTGGSAIAPFQKPTPKVSAPVPKKSKKSEMRDRFLEFLDHQKKPWSFLPILNACINQSIEDGLTQTATALIMVFRPLDVFLDKGPIEECIIASIQLMRRRSKFVPAAHLISLSPFWEDKMGTVQADADTTCHHCLASLRENTALFAKDSGGNASIGYWYCSRCKQLLNGCSLCNLTVRGLGVVVLLCGHRIHPECWDTWLSTGMKDCPAGCGQEL